MRIFVAGATGVVGQRAVALLIEAGHAVTGVARSSGKQALLESLGATPSDANLFDRGQLMRSVDGNDAVVNLATHIPPLSKATMPGAWSENDRIRTEASRNLVDAATAAHAGLYIQESIVFGYPDRGEEWIDEDVALDPVGPVRSAVAAEAQAKRFTDEGSTGVVLRFGGFYAPDSTHTGVMVRAAKRGVAATLGKPDSYMSSIHADDAAAAVVAALSVQPGTYNVVDDQPLTKKENAEALAEALKVKSPKLPPAVLASLGGSRTKLLARSQRVSNKRFCAASSWRPRYPSARQGWPAVVAQLRAAEAGR